MPEPDPAFAKLEPQPTWLSRWLLTQPITSKDLLGFTIVLSFVGFGAWSSFVHYFDAALTGKVLDVLGTLTALIVQHVFGSSLSSGKKDDTIATQAAAIAKTNGGH